MAARWEDERTARSAALAGSKVCSTSGLSCVTWRCVGDEAFLGVAPPSMIFLVDHVLFIPPLELCDDWTEEGVGAGGDSIEGS